MNQRVRNLEAILLLAMLSCLLGCTHKIADSGRRQLYKITFTQAIGGPTNNKTRVSDEEDLYGLLSGVLESQGFKQKSRSPAMWLRRGAMVALYHQKGGDLILEIGALGDDETIQLSERAEAAIVALLGPNSGVELTPITKRSESELQPSNVGARSTEAATPRCFRGSASSRQLAFNQQETYPHIPPDPNPLQQLQNPKGIP